MDNLIKLTNSSETLPPLPTSPDETRLVDKNRVPAVWCPGCGDFGVLQALTTALKELGKTTRDTVLVSGIGCSGRLPYFVSAYGFHALHGRPLPIATGIKLANPKLTVVVVAGDGDAFGIGAGHIPHAARRNVDITYLILDNEVYALTKGHSSPTTEAGQRTSSARNGETATPLDIPGLLLMYRTSFVAQTFSGDRPRLTGLIKEAILHPGFSALHIMSPCPTYNPAMDYDTIREAKTIIPDSHPRNDFSSALGLVTGKNGLLDGVIYQDSSRQVPEGEMQEPIERFSEGFNNIIGRYA